LISALIESPGAAIDVPPKPRFDFRTDLSPRAAIDAPPDAPPQQPPFDSGNDLMCHRHARVGTVGVCVANQRCAIERRCVPR
jgi:hypothetical protein